MKLKKLELLGFKSFADKTRFVFHPGITAIVGPNGCGKSNISDAFRWVLGEQSAKSMRGNKMHDVVFAGTSDRRALNLAEVTITFSEVNGYIPTEYEEIAVTRRLHRSGESEYLINRRPARLKDVYDLFLDSGIGKNAFSIFEQGKIDQVINLSSLERRYIFEEAAGILRFLQKKGEALRRLEQTEHNIERVKDIHKEVEKQITILEEQAEKAKIYKENKLKLERLEVALFAAKREELNKKLFSLQEREKLKKGEIAVLEKELEKGEIARQNENIRLVHVQKEYHLLKERVLKTKSEKEMKSKEQKNCRERLEEMAEKEKRWEADLKGQAEKRKRRQEEKEALKTTLEEVAARLLEQKGEKEALQKKVRALEADVEGMSEGRHAAQKELLLHLNKEKQVESELKQALLRKEHNQERKKSLLEKQEVLGQRLQKLQKEIGLKQRDMEKEKAVRLKEKERFSLLEQKIEEAKSQAAAANKKRGSLSQERAELKARQKVLRRMQEDMEGFSAGTKRLLLESSRESSPLFGKLQGLYESLFPEEGAEMALSVVMRPFLQTLVVQSKEDFLLVAAFAKKAQIREFSLLCLADLEMLEKKGSKQKEKSLLSFVQNNVLAKHFLEKVLVAKDKEEGIKALLQAPGVRVWTEDGIFIDQNGVAFFTSEGEQNVFLREAELNVLVKKISFLEKGLESIEKEIDAINKRRFAFENEKKELSEALRLSEMRLVEAKYALGQLESDHEKGKKEREKELLEANTLSEIEKKLEKLLTGLNQELIAARKKLEAFQKQADSLVDTFVNRKEELKQKEEALRERNLAFQKNYDEKQKILHALTVIDVKEAEGLQQSLRLEEERRSVKEKQEEIKQMQEGFRVELKEIEEAFTKTHRRSLELKEKSEAQKKSISFIEESIAKKQADLKRKAKDLQDVKILLAQLDSSKQTLEMAFKERFCLTADEAKAAGGLLQSIEKAEKEIRAIRRLLEEAGDINMASIEEFDKLKVRYQFLNQQIEDLDAAKEELVEIITRLDSESKKLFKETFEVIRENFKRNFQVLFRGGEADLQFSETGNVLEAGIEIIAKPPGKQMRSINLLSGGEKCLTATALLFAIFEVKPAPFCILDEIDAPLDDTNVERFVNVVKQFTDKCQFIIITHNKRTMAIADRIFGVSMQEKGVSKVLSLEFSKEKEPELAMV